jgi:hypothetical protein
VRGPSPGSAPSCGAAAGGIDRDSGAGAPCAPCSPGGEPSGRGRLPSPEPERRRRPPRDPRRRRRFSPDPGGPPPPVAGDSARPAPKPPPGVESSSVRYRRSPCAGLDGRGGTMASGARRKELESDRSWGRPMASEESSTVIVNGLDLGPQVDSRRVVQGRAARHARQADRRPDERPEGIRSSSVSRRGSAGLASPER